MDGGAWWAAVYEVAQSRTRAQTLATGVGTALIQDDLASRSFFCFVLFLPILLKNFFGCTTRLAGS